MRSSSRQRPAVVTVTIRTRVTAAQYAELRQLAEEDASTVSHVVRRMVARQLRAGQSLEPVSHGAA